MKTLNEYLNPINESTKNDSYYIETLFNLLKDMISTDPKKDFDKCYTGADEYDYKWAGCNKKISKKCKKIWESVYDKFIELDNQLADDDIIKGNAGYVPHIDEMFGF